MRLLLADQFSDPGGAQQGLLELLPAIRRRGWNALVALPGEGEIFARARELGFEVRQIRCGPYHSGRKSPADVARFVFDTPILAGQLRRLGGEFAADLVYLNGPRLLPAAGRARLPVPLVFHSHSYLARGAIVQMAGKALARAQGWLIGSCRYVAAPWEPYVPPERRRVIYNGVSDAPAPRAPRTGPPVVASIGRIAPEKGQREFVLAAARIRRVLPDCRFVVYGAALFAEPGAQRYDREVRALGAREGVEFPGWVSEIHPALAAIDLLLVPSASHEATTRVILEAHAAGVPVIAFRSGGIPEVVEHGRDGWLVDSTEEMADCAIALLTSDAAALQAVAREARESWRRRFTLDRYHQELLDALAEAATSPRGSLPGAPPAAIRHSRP